MPRVVFLISIAIFLIDLNAIAADSDLKKEVSTDDEFKLSASISIDSVFELSGNLESIGTSLTCAAESGSGEVGIVLKSHFSVQGLVYLSANLMVCQNDAIELCIGVGHIFKQGTFPVFELRPIIIKADPLNLFAFLQYTDITFFGTKKTADYQTLLNGVKMGVSLVWSFLYF